MAKIQAPKVTPATPAPAPEAPAPDLSALIASLQEPLEAAKEAEANSKSALLDCVVVAREYRAENPSVERSDVRLAIQTAVAGMLGIKLAKVQSSPANDGDAYGYSLASSIFNTAWPKGEDEEKRVIKALKQGKGWVEVRKAASKPSAVRATDTKKFTAENFATKLNLFLQSAREDLEEELEETLVRAEAVIGAIRSAPAA